MGDQALTIPFLFLPALTEIAENRGHMGDQTLTTLVKNSLRLV